MPWLRFVKGAVATSSPTHYRSPGWLRRPQRKPGARPASVRRISCSAVVQHGVLRELRDRLPQQRRAGHHPGTEPGRAGPGPGLRVRHFDESPTRESRWRATYRALSLAREQVFEGDVGTTVPGASHRQGVEFSTGSSCSTGSLQWQLHVHQGHLRHGGGGAAGPALDGPRRSDRALSLGAQRRSTPSSIWARATWTEDRSVIGDGYTLAQFTTRYRYKNVEAFL